MSDAAGAEAASLVAPSIPLAISGLRSPFDRGRDLRAVLFDLDGTLYRQGPVRALMALELATLPFRGPQRARRSLRAIAAYRAAQEALRGQAAVAPDSQLAAAAGASRLEMQEVENVIREWMFVRPLKYLRVCRAPGLLPLLGFLRRQGLVLGVLSDYPAHDKLTALGLDGYFALVLSSSDPEVGAFKPSPAGFLRASQIWGLAPAQILVVGDRSDVDAAGALAAGMDCVVVGSRSATKSGNCLFVRSMKGLHRVLHDCR